MQIRTTLIALSLPACASSAWGYPPPPIDPSLPESTVEIAVQQIRRDMNDEGINALTFRNMDEIFTIRKVSRSGEVSELRRNDYELNFSYEHDGKSYTPEEFLDRTYTNALIIIKNDEIVYENYRNNTNASTPFMGWSMTKSWTSLLIGKAVEEGLISSIEDPVDQYLSELADSGYAGVSIKHILQMRSGVEYEERYDFGNPGIAARNHENALVKNVVRFADAARGIERKHEPGTVWEYKTIDTAVLGWLIERVSGGSVAAYTTEKLWEPLGMSADGFYIMDGPPGIGREFSGAGFNATARDYARLGLLLLNEGNANDKRVISQDWIREATAPTGGDGPGYGYQFWMGKREGSYAAIGLQGQYVYVDPATRTVIVKLSYFPLGDETVEAEVDAFFAAATDWKPE